MVKVKRFLIIVAIFLLVNPISSPQHIFAEENVTDESFIEIENSEDLANIKEDLTEDYILTKNIDLKDAEWKPIDTGEFTGTLTGNDFIIKNMPVKYIEDENFGLFAEVEDSNNIDVEIEFVEEEIDEKAEEETEEPPIIEEEVVEKETEEPSAEEEIVEEETEEPKVEEEPQAEEEAVKEDSKDEKNKLAQNRAVVSKDVSTQGEFRRALKDSTITLINLKANISTSSQDWNRIDIAAREVVINGKDGDEIRELKQNNSGLNYAMFRADLKTGTKTKITFKDINLVSLNNNSIITQTGATTDWDVIFDNVNERTKIDESTGVGNFDGRLVNAKNAHVEFKGVIKFITKDQSIIADAKSVTIDAGAKVSLLTRGKIYETSHNGAKLHVKPGGELFLFGDGERNISAVELIGGDSEILVEGIFTINSDRRVTGQHTGLIRLAGANGEFNVGDGATVDFSHAEGSILHMSSENGKVNISGKETKVQFSVQEGNGNYDAPIYLEAANNYELNVSDKALFEVVKEGGQSMGIRVGQGNGHKVIVTGGAKLSIHNKGNGTPTNPADNNAKNQALYFNTLNVSKANLPRFKLESEGSEVELIADSGVAMHMTNGGNIEALKGTSFIAHGRTASAANGVIDTGGVNDKGSIFTMNNPAFYDFRNNNTAGFIFLVGTDSEFHGIKTDVAVWKRGSNAKLDGRHDNRWVNVNYKFKGIEFKDLISTPESAGGSADLEAEMGKTGGLKQYARLSGNNARPVVDKLYQPTNADNKVYAHVSIDEGIFGERNAHTNEVEVEVTQTKLDNTINVLKGKTIGENHEEWVSEDIYEIYEKPVDENIGTFGWAEIKLDDDTFLEVGDELKVTSAKIVGTAQHIVSEPEDLFKDTLTTVDVIPPEPTVPELPFNEETSKYELTSDSTVLKGTLPTADEEENVAVSVKKHNGDNVEGTYEENRGNNTFEYTFTNDLVADDEISSFLTRCS